MGDVLTDEPFKGERVKPGSKPRTVVLDGMVFAFVGEQPWLGEIDGEFHLPVFSSLRKLHAFMASVGVEPGRLKRIDNGLEFLSSIPPEVHVVLDPHQVGNHTEYCKVLKG